MLHLRALSEQIADSNDHLPLIDSTDKGHPFSIPTRNYSGFSRAIRLPQRSLPDIQTGYLSRKQAENFFKKVLAFSFHRI